MTDDLKRALIALTTLTMMWSIGQAQTPAPVRQADFIVAVVNSEPVTNSEVMAMRERMVQAMRARGKALPQAQALTRQALDELINQKAKLQLAQEQGIRIDDDQIDQMQANAAASAGLSPTQFEQQLARSGQSLTTYRQQTREQLMLQRLGEREVEARIRISDSDIQAYLDKHAEASAPQLNLAMILVSVPENSSESQLKALEQRAQDIGQRARSGEDFAVLAKAFSQSADKGLQGGEMGLRPSDRYPELFTQAVRNTPVNGIAGPVRSAAGLHILKVLERRQNPPVLSVTQTRSRHILLRPTARLSRDEAVSRLQDLRQSILNGRQSFASAAREISQDGSAAQGGDLGWTVPGQFVPEFEEVMNRLSPGQISAPLVSRFGVHILEVTERRRVLLSENESRDIARNALRENQLEDTYARWTEEVRGRAYVEMRDPPELLAPAANR